MQATNQISTISIIGSGNVATALGLALSQSGLKVVEVFSPNIANSKLLSSKIGCNYVESIEKLNPNSDLYIIATPDKEIGNVSSKLKNVVGAIAHTSGSESISVFSSFSNNYGVFYPLQTFTVDNVVSFNDVPICIEGSNEKTIQLLKTLANNISNNVVVINSQQRQLLHLAAVMVNNFSNSFYDMAHNILHENDIDFSLLHPLIKETANKIDKVIPSNAQTGPARRNDVDTINTHLELLNKHPEYSKLYRLMSNQIIKKYHGKL